MVRDKSFYRTLIRLAIPAAVQGFISLLVNQADMVMVSSLGDNMLAGVAQSNSATAFFTAAVGGMASGSSVLIAQYWGRKDEERIRRIFAMISMLCLAIAVAAVSAIQIWPRWLLGRFTDNPAVLNAGLPYFRLVAASYLPFALSTALIVMLRSVEVVNVTLYTTSAALITNIGLNYTFIFGKLGFPAMGVFGAALATVISRFIELGIVWWYLFYKQKRFSIKPSNLLRGDSLLWRDYVKFGMPVGFSDLQWALVGVGKAAIIGRLGSTMIAANTITTGLMELGRVFSSSLTIGACVMIGMTVGQKDYKKTREYSNTIQILFVFVGCFMALMVYALRGPYASLYGNISAEARRLSNTLLSIGALTMIGTTYHASCFIGINRGAGDSRFVLVVDMICGWLVVLPLSALAAFVWRWPLPMVFLCIYIDQCFKWLIAFIRLRGNKWIRNVTRE
ncbi:MAG: MATE family efflux transporter [Oscillospiraceae bacterium]|jgi:putative MATE family efflux protein|nr:MATE family efflux transporter [Oscillospiraceae bacterium]